MSSPRYSRVSYEDFKAWAAVHNWLLVDEVDQENYHRANFVTPSGETLMVSSTNGNIQVAKCASWKM